MFYYCLNKVVTVDGYHYWRQTMLQKSKSEKCGYALCKHKLVESNVSQKLYRTQKLHIMFV